MLESLYWLGGSVALLIAYVFVSNALWLLFGSKVIQKLPGVNIKGFRGTLKIALMLFLSATGFLFWISKYFVMLILLKNPKPKLSNEISQKIKWGARITKNKL